MDKELKSGDRDMILQYLEYLQGRVEESSDFFKYVVAEIKKIDFDDENGSDLIKAADSVSMSMRDVIDHFESLAKAASDLSGREIQRDVKINKVLRK